MKKGACHENDDVMGIVLFLLSSKSVRDRCFSSSTIRMSHVHVSHVRNDDRYPPPGSGFPGPFPGPGSFNPAPPPPGNFQLPPPQPPGYPGGGRWDQDGYQGYFNQGYPPPPPRPMPPQHYNLYQRPYEYDYDYGCDSFLRRCLGFLCCCWLLEACCFWTDGSGKTKGYAGVPSNSRLNADICLYDQLGIVVVEKTNELQNGHK